MKIVIIAALLFIIFGGLLALAAQDWVVWLAWCLAPIVAVFIMNTAIEVGERQEKK